ncbi:MAG: segregation and condensation protein A [Phycisphaerales bacterium]
MSLEDSVAVEYRVRLEAFEGPLDLLLFLIRRAEVEITDIPIAAIAAQYMAYLSEVERIDIDRAGEFLVLAATLMEIKSRMIGPGAEGAGEASVEGERTAEDPRADLVRQLLAYKQFRDASEALGTRRTEWEARFPASGADDAALRSWAVERADGVDLGDVTLADLAEAFSRIAATVNFDRLGEHTVQYDDTPIEIHAEDVLDRLRRQGSEMPLREVLTGRTRGEMIGLFLAVLELVRRGAATVRQEGGEIVMGLREPDADRTILA